MYQKFRVSDHCEALFCRYSRKGCNIPPGLFLISYVVNIGFSRAWKKWSAIFSAGPLHAIDQWEARSSDQ